MDAVLPGKISDDGSETEEYQPQTGPDAEGAEHEEEEREPDADALFWKKQIEAALINERRWRGEGMAAEILYFGPDDDTGDSSPDPVKESNPISEKTSTVHANIEVIKPLLFSETPTPIVRRRFKGDGKRTDATDIAAVEVGQRLAQYILSTSRFDTAMEGVRDDWLIPGRGVARAFYKATFADAMDEVGAPIRKKVNEEVYCKRWEWRRFLTAPGSWDQMPWIAFEVPMSRAKIKKHPALAKYADAINYSQQGLTDRGRAINDDDRTQSNSLNIDPDSSGEMAKSPFDTTTVWEIWNKEEGKVIWWSPGIPGEILHVEDDPLGLEEFWPMPKPMLATVKGDELTPRPDVRYYEAAADEVELATKKLKELLKVLAVAGLFPGQFKDSVEKLLSGKNAVYPVESWIALMDKGGSRDLIQWLPIDAIVAAIAALNTMREQAKQRMFEASGVSDIMRAQGDPRESATAQNLKGKYAGMRLSTRQRAMAIYARDMLRILIEMAVELFDLEFINDIVAMEIPLYEAERQQEIARQEAIKAAHQVAVAEYTNLQQLAEQAAQAGAQVQMPTPPPPLPEMEEVPETSLELVMDRLRNDLSRKITIQIETESTILADEQADKEARTEFLSAFSVFVQQIMPLVGTGQFDLKTAKELLLFGVRGFPKARTLETMISDLPDEMPPQQDTKEVQEKVAEIKAQVDLKIAEMEMADKERERQHEMRMKGADLATDAAKMAAEAPPPPKQQTQGA